MALRGHETQQSILTIGQSNFRSFNGCWKLEKKAKHKTINHSTS